MARISKEEILKRANDYIQFMIKEINENKDGFVEYNKKSISDFEELQAYMSLYKYGTEEYKKIAYKYIKMIFGRWKYEKYRGIKSYC